MSSVAQRKMTPNEAVENAARELVSVRHWGDRSFVSLPLTAPDGGPATVRVTPIHGGFRVDDAEFAYQDLERIGLERSFAKTAGTAAVAFQVTVNKRMICVDVTAEQLERAISDVGAASWSIVSRVHERLAEIDEAEVEDVLRPRLEHIFGAPKVEAADAKIVGSSSNEWPVSAIVHNGGKTVVFQAVGEHANSVYRTSSAFHDLALLPDPPTLVSVVKDRSSLGAKLNILAQAGKVIQSDQSDEVYLRAAA